MAGCELCQSTPHDLFPDWDEMVAEAEEAGLTTCINCNFEYYQTVDICPSCQGHKKENQK